MSRKTHQHQIGLISDRNKKFPNLGFSSARFRALWCKSSWWVHLSQWGYFHLLEQKGLIGCLYIVLHAGVGGIHVRLRISLSILSREVMKASLLVICNSELKKTRGKRLHGTWSMCIHPIFSLCQGFLQRLSSFSTARSPLEPTMPATAPSAEVFSAL